MRTILFLVPDLQCYGYAKQATLLATTLPREQFVVHVGVLGKDGIFSKRLRQTGIPVHSVGASRSWLQGALGLRRLLRELSPDAVQAWGGAVPWAACARSVRLDRCPWKLIAVDPHPRIWLRAAAKVVAHFSHDAERIHYPHTRVISLAVEEHAPTLERAAFLQSCGLPGAARFVLCAGVMVKRHGFREAVWI